MPRQKIDLVDGELYHVCYRAVGDSIIFKNDDDHFRGIFSLYEFNDSNPKEIWLRRKQRKAEKKKALGTPTPNQLISTRNNFVDVLTFCFMPNHIHLLLRQIVDNGISKFIQKIGGGYVGYFNKKYNRRGHLFNQFKAIHIKGDEQLKHLVTYIHCNPISLIEPNWKENGINNPKKVLDFLENKYRWSSLWDYNNKENFQSVTSRDFLIETVGQSEMKEDLKNWIEYKNNLNKSLRKYNDLFIE